MGGSYASQRADVAIPNEWLRPGENTVKVVTGTFAGDCNRDDFTISNLALTPAVGTAAGVGLKPSYAMGDGTCGSSGTALREVTLTFQVDAPARGLRADVDTATLPDGEHELAATSTTGETATRALFTDNSGPALVSSHPRRRRPAHLDRAARGRRGGRLRRGAGPGRDARRRGDRPRRPGRPWPLRR